MSELRIGVLGAGVVGLTTALQLQETFRQAKVDVIADKFNTDTTSYVAAGIFRPGTSFCGPDDATTSKWVNDSYSYWDELRGGREAANAGITHLSGYIFSSKSANIVRNHLIEHLVPLYRRATEAELRICPGDWKYGSFFTTILTETARFLPWATERFKQNAGRLVKKEIASFRDLHGGAYDVVVNCAGLGAKQLCNDHKLVPIRGQVIKVKANWLKTFFYGDYDTYVIPGFNSVTLGGCRNYDSYDTTVSKYDSLAIRERCEALVPSLKTAPAVAEYVGLRPHRDPVRVERETLRYEGQSMKVVHNYGHGGYGVTTAPGTAKHAVRLVVEALSGSSKL